MSLDTLFTDAFEDGTLSGLWHPVGPVEESNGRLRIGAGDGNGIVGNYWFAPDFELTATVSSGNAGIVGATGTKRLDAMPLDEGAFLSVTPAGEATLTLRGGGSVTTTLPVPPASEVVRLTVRYDVSGDSVTAAIEGDDRTETASLDASGSRWVSLAPVLGSGGSAFDIHDVTLRSSARFETPFDVTAHDRVVHADMVTDPPTEPHIPKEPAAVKAGGTIYLAIAGFNGYESVEGANTFVDRRVTRKDITLWTSDSALGPFEQVSIVADRDIEGEFDESRKSGYQHAPAIAAFDDELWVLYNNRETDEVHARHAPLGAIPSSASGWSHEVLFGNASDVKSVISHDGRVHVAFSDAPFEKAQLVSGPDLLSLGDRTTLVETDDRATTHYRDAIVAPHVLPSPDGGWYMLLSERIADGGFSYYGGIAVLYADELRGEYTPKGTTAGAVDRPGSHPDIWMAPGRINEDVLADRTKGYLRYRAGHAVFCYEEGMERLATHDGRYFGYFEGEDDAGFHVMGFVV